MNGYGRGEDSRNEKVSAVISRETFGMTILLFSIVLLVISILGPFMFGDIGVAINAFLMGVFGFFTYPFLLFCIGGSFCLVLSKKPVKGIWVLRVLCVILSAFLIVHLATSEKYLGAGFSSYMGGCWNAASQSVKDATGGGVAFGIIVYPLQAILSKVGAYVILSLLAALSVFFFLWGTPLRKKLSRTGQPEEEKPLPAKAKKGAQQPAREPYRADQPYQAAEPSQQQNYTQPAQPSYQQQNYTQPAQPSYQQNYTQPAQLSYQQQNYSQPSQQRRGSAYNSPYLQDFDRYTPPMEQTAPTEPMDILYGADPASSYRNNLIYNRDSQFNTFNRRSSVLPDDAPARANTPDIPVRYERTWNYPRRPEQRTEPPKYEPPKYEAPKYQPPQQPPRYADEYRTQAEAARPTMPRKVVEQRPAQSFADLNYTRQPSYKAPDDPAATQEDFYRSDVTEDFSSAPNVFDDEEDRDAVSGFRSGELKRASLEPEPEPVKSEPRSVQPPMERTPAFEQPAAQPQEQPVPVRDEGREHLRDLFSVDRGSQERTVGFGGSQERTVGFGDRSGAPDRAPRELVRGNDDMDRGMRDFGRGGEEPDRGMRDFGRGSEEPDRGMRDFGRGNEEMDRGMRDFGPREDRIGNEERGERADFTLPPEEDAGESRAMDGLSRADLFDDDEPELPPRREEPIRRERETPVHAMPEAPAPKPVKHVYRPYCPPSLGLLKEYDENVSIGQDEIDRNSQIIIDTLAGFRIDAEIMHVTVGPTVTRYDITIPNNVSVGNVVKRDAEIAMRLHARVNIFANTEAGAISIEVPNSVRATVGLRSILQSEEFRRKKPGSLVFAIGKNIEGKIICGDIVKMKHLLIAGGTGSGKSVCLNAMLISLMYHYSPEELRLILIDPKRVEFAVYDGIPHLMINEIITEPPKAVTALNWAIKEMERRYLLFEQKTRSGVTVQNIDHYNEAIGPDEEKLPKILIVFDELADFMAVAKKDIEDRISRLTAKARAAGIHLVISTQRPSVDVVTGVIKTNLPTRIACRVSAEVDSRTILDESGAQKLLGNGDMLYRAESMFSCERLQGAFLSPQEIGSIVEEIKEENESYFDEGVAEFINRTEEEEEEEVEEGDPDSEADGNANPEYIRALAMVVKLGQASISLIQRKCSIGYNHAGKIIEWMELMGYISPFDGKAKARTTLLTKEEFESKYGPLE